MNYYNEIKNEIIDIEIYKKVKDYSKNKRELEGYYKIGKILIEYKVESLELNMVMD